MAHPEHIVDVVRRKKSEGVPNLQIGHSIGLTEGAVKALCHQRGIKRGPRPKVRLESSLLLACLKEADRREERLDQFLRKLMTSIVRGNLFSAIIDDGK